MADDDGGIVLRRLEDEPKDESWDIWSERTRKLGERVTRNHCLEHPSSCCWSRTDKVIGYQGRVVIDIVVSRQSFSYSDPT
jgi:hypothetical protein